MSELSLLRLSTCRERLRIKVMYGTPWLVELRVRALMFRSWTRTCDGCGRRWHSKGFYRGGGDLPRTERYCTSGCCTEPYDIDTTEAAA